MTDAALSLLLLIAFIAGCPAEPGPQRSVSQAWQQPPERTPVADGRAATRPAADGSQAPGGEPVAVINGQPIPRLWLTDTLITSHGLGLLLQRISLEAVRQVARQEQISIAPPEVDAEYDLTLELGASQAADPSALTPSRRQQLIDRWRAARGVSTEELQLAMERQAWLRKLAAKRLVVTEEMLRNEFGRLHGAKVECRHIAVESARKADEIRAYLDAGEDFETLARRRSINDATAARGGLLPPFSPTDETIPGVLREAAAQMQPGQVSNPIKVDGQYHILRLERRIPPETLQFDAVRGDIERKLRERLIPVEMERLLTSLTQASSISISDPVLRQQYLERLKEGRIAGPTLRP